MPAVAISSGPYGGLNGYWGQYGSDPLMTYCDGLPEYVTLAFITASPENQASGWPATNFAGHCPGTTFPYTDSNNVVHDSNLWSDCYEIMQGIPYCQSLGVKVLISIGGELTSTGNYTVTSTQNALSFADFLYNAFGPKQPDYTGPRPFDSELWGEVAVDGFDFDIEADLDNGPYITMINHLRELDPSVIITGAPQCPLSDQYFYMKQMISEAQFDALFVQFYNNPDCDLLGTNTDPVANTNYDAWENFLATTDLSKSAKLYVGLPGSTASAGSGYVDSSVIKTVVNELAGRPNFGGISLWDLTRGAMNQDPQTGVTFNEEVENILNCGNTVLPTTTTTSVATSTTSVTTTTTSAVSTTTEPTTTTTSAISTTTEPTTTTTSAISTTTEPTTTTTSAISTTTEPATTSTTESASTTPGTTTSTESASTTPGTTTSTESASTTPGTTSTESATTTSGADTSTTESASTTPGAGTSTTESASTTPGAGTSTTEPASTTPGAGTSTTESASTTPGSGTSTESASTTPGAGTSTAESTTTPGANTSTNESATTTPGANTSTAESVSTTPGTPGGATSTVESVSTTPGATTPGGTTSTTESASTTPGAGTSTAESTTTPGANTSTTESASTTPGANTSTESVSTTPGTPGGATSTVESVSTTPGATTPGGGTTTTEPATSTTESVSTTPGTTTPGGNTSSSISSAESVSTTPGNTTPNGGSSTIESTLTSSETSLSEATSGSTTQAANPTSSSGTVGQETSGSTTAAGHTSAGGNSQTTSGSTSITSGSAQVTESVSMTVSTVYTTHTYTVTKCPPTVTNCPAGGYVTTETVALYTTICPVTEGGKGTTKTAESKPETTGEGEVKTLYTTKIYTITKCPPTVTNCPVGSVTTKVSSWTTTVAQGVPTGPANMGETVSKSTVVVEEAPESTAPLNGQETAPYEEVPEATSTTRATTIIYKTVVVPPSTLTSLSKPVSTNYGSGAESTSKQPGGVAAPTGGCVGEYCSTSTHAYSAPTAPPQPVTGGASAVRAGLLAMSVMTILQMFIL